MICREYTLGENGVYRHQRDIQAHRASDLIDRHEVNGTAPSVRVYTKPVPQFHVQGANETAPTVYIPVQENQP